MPRFLEALEETRVGDINAITVDLAEVLIFWIRFTEPKDGYWFNMWL